MTIIGFVLSPSTDTTIPQIVLKLNLNGGLEALDLIWDGNSTVSSTVHGMYYEGTSGLCGTWDDNKDNDQISSVGENEFDDVAEFGWSWKIEGEKLIFTINDIEYQL